MSLPTMSLLCPYYVPTTLFTVPTYSMSLPTMSLPTMSLLCPYYVPTMSILCPYYVPTMSLPTLFAYLLPSTFFFIQLKSDNEIFPGQDSNRVYAKLDRVIALLSKPIGLRRQPTAPWYLIDVQRWYGPRLCPSPSIFIIKYFIENRKTYYIISTSIDVTGSWIRRVGHDIHQVFQVN